MREIRNNLVVAGVPVECTKGEWAPGQAEINVRYSDALAMADRHVFLKNAIKEMAYFRGEAVTFMAKWRDHLAGSSAHIHMSLAEPSGDESLSHDPKAPCGMSETMRRFLAGQIAHASEIALILAPNINSYKRFQAGTFAPTHAVWSVDNRTSAFRVCGAGSKSVRIECRIGGADLNPYLAIAALVAAGADGIRSGLELGPSLPRTLREAIASARASWFLRDAFGEDVVEHYLRAAEWEQHEHDRHVTDWELMRGFERG